MNGIGIRSSPSRDTGSTLLSLSILADVMVRTEIRFGVLIQSPIPYGSEKSSTQMSGEEFAILI